MIEICSGLTSSTSTKIVSRMMLAQTGMDVVITMSKVERFWCHEAQNIRCVREADYDALAADNKRLREALNTAMNSMLDSGYSSGSVVIQKCRAALAGSRDTE